jgi:2,4-dienoyl-CoA reductase (NADPH2)
MVSMARPLLADAAFVRKAREGRAHEINICIACNQACLDHIFKKETCSCLVNPRACRETELNYLPATGTKAVAVVGAGPAGLACASIAARRGHRVTLFERDDKVGGQFNMAKEIPGKAEFADSIRYFHGEAERSGVDLQLSTEVTAGELEGFDEVVLATGVHPRGVDIPGADHPMVVSYVDVITGRVRVGKRVALIGAGGIGFDLAEYLCHDPTGPDSSQSFEAFAREWGIDRSLEARGGVEGVQAQVAPCARETWLLQRTEGKLGKGLGKTTGWVHRLGLHRRGVKMLGGVTYRKIDDHGLHITVGGEERLLEVDNVVTCAGQLSNRDLAKALDARGVEYHLIGGAHKAAELDAKHAIREGSELAATL